MLKKIGEQTEDTQCLQMGTPTNVLVNQSEKLRSMEKKARVESSQSSFTFESVIKVSFLIPKFLGFVKNETFSPRPRAVTQLTKYEKATKT